MKAAVVIPVYKSVMDKQELISFTQVCNVLKNFPMILVCPKGLNLSAYYDVYPKLSVEYFESDYFKDLEGYNRLMLSANFYNRFQKYHYILVYQLDAFVFKDELEYWCNKGYDYIGAPWFEDWHKSTPESKIVGVGNGGFSLRNVSGILNQIKILKLLQVKHKYEKYNLSGLFIRIHKIISDVIRYNRFEPVYNMTNGQEDYFWCVDMKHIYNVFGNKKGIAVKIFKRLFFKKLKIADIETAMKFSMECQSARLFEENKNTLPFGCHAWYKYDYEFWKPFIIAKGYHLS